MEETHERPLTVEPDDPRHGGPIQLPTIGGDVAANADYPVINHLTLKINREHAAVVRLVKGLLRATLRVGGALDEAQGVLGSGFPDWIRTKLPFTEAEAGFLIRVSGARLRINERISAAVT